MPIPVSYTHLDIPLLRAVPYGVQHILAMFVANLAPIVIVAGAAGLGTDQTGSLIQSAMLIAGIGTLIQLFPLGRIGSGLPIVMGISLSLIHILGQKKAREIWYLCRQYTAAEALEMGLVNKVVPFDQLEAECVSWAREMLRLSPTALRFMKASFNAATDGLAGIQQLAGDATLLYYTTDEAKEGRDAFKEKRAPDFTQFPKFP